MKLTINITKQHFFIICAIIILSSGAIVYAMNSGDPNLMGHSGDEIVSLPFNKITPGTTDLAGGNLEITNGNLNLESLTLDGKNVFVQEKLHTDLCDWNGTACVPEDGYLYYSCGDYDYNIVIEQKPLNPCSAVTNQLLCDTSFTATFPARYYSFCMGFDITP